MARALELVLSCYPRDDTTQVRADRIDTEGLDLRVARDDEVCGVTLQAHITQHTDKSRTVGCANHRNGTESQLRYRLK
jgi:hypothetical protein